MADQYSEDDEAPEGLNPAAFFGALRGPSGLVEEAEAQVGIAGGASVAPRPPYRDGPYKPPVGHFAAADNELHRIRESIGYFESRGHYDAVGVLTKDGDRALGKYQIMGNNVAAWTKEATGHAYTREEFLNNPKLQDQTAEYMLGHYYSKYGTVEHVASCWFSGQPLTDKNRNKRDANGTTVETYAARVREIHDSIPLAPAVALAASDGIPLSGGVRNNYGQMKLQHSAMIDTQASNDSHYGTDNQVAPANATATKTAATAPQRNKPALGMIG